MILYPGATCTYKTFYDTKVEYEKQKVDVEYYNLEGQTLPMVGSCFLSSNVPKLLSSDLEIDTGIMGGLISGNCGYYVTIENKNRQVSSLVTIYRNVKEASLSSIRLIYVYSLIFALLINFI